jgi:hypothetical protein
VLKAGFSIVRDANTLFGSCIVRPTWYAQDLFFASPGVLRSDLSTRYIIDNVEHQFAGTATRCGTDPDGNSPTDGEACDMRDVLIVGFDVCDDTRNSANAVLSNVKCEGNVGEFIHDQGGGLKLENANVHNFIEAGMNDNSGKDFSTAEWPVTAIQSDTNAVKLTIHTGGMDPADQVVNGDTILLSGVTIGNGPQAQNARWIVKCSNTPPDNA